MFEPGKKSFRPLMTADFLLIAERIARLGEF